MGKKIIGALFQNICAKDELHPFMNGVHFEEDRSYATDGRILVIVNFGKSSLAGKTIDKDGNEIEGRYPNIDKVIPRGEDYEVMNVDVMLLSNACLWHKKQEGSNRMDCVVIGDDGYNIGSLQRLLSTLLAEEKAQDIEWRVVGCGKPAVLHGKNTQGLIMPMLYEYDKVDEDREEYCAAAYSYENLINDFVFNSWKKKEPKKAFGWLD